MLFDREELPAIGILFALQGDIETKPRSRKTRYWVGFAQEEVRVTVEDNGKGFDPRGLSDSKSRMMASGFWTIRQRLADLVPHSASVRRKAKVLRPKWLFRIR
jgi:hypothetical protein